MLSVTNTSAIRGLSAVELNSYSMSASGDCSRVLQAGESCTLTITYTATYPHYDETGQLYVGFSGNKVAAWVKAFSQ